LIESSGFRRKALIALYLSLSQLPDFGYFSGLALHSEVAPIEEVANKIRTAFTEGKYALDKFRIPDNSATISCNPSLLVWCPDDSIVDLNH